MNDQDPKTRHLSRAELARVLHTSVLDTPELEIETQIWKRPARAESVRPCEPATQLEVQVPIDRKVELGAQERERETYRLPRRWVASRTVITRLGIGLLVMSCAWWVGLRPRPLNASAEPPRAVASLQSGPSVQPPKNVVVPAPASTGMQAPSPRVAVDLLLAGHEREALDAYRALALYHPNEPSFASLVMQLERELSNCDKEPGSCAR